jgi:hypothetical protein
LELLWVIKKKGELKIYIQRCIFPLMPFKHSWTLSPLSAHSNIRPQGSQSDIISDIGLTFLAISDIRFLSPHSSCMVMVLVYYSDIGLVNPISKFSPISDYSNLGLKSSISMPIYALNHPFHSKYNLETTVVPLIRFIIMHHYVCTVTVVLSCSFLVSCYSGPVM